MAQTLKLTNFSTNNIVDQTQLTADVPAASNSLPVSNANDFSTGYLLVGVRNSKTAELLPNANASSGQSVALTSSTVLPHNQYDPVIALFGNQLRIYRAANVDGSQPADGSFSLLQTIDIDPNDDATTFNDQTGGGGFWYKYTFYNSATGSETGLSSSTAVRGNFTVNYCSLDQIRREAGFTNAPYVTDDQIDEKRQAAQAEINGALDEFYQTPLQPPISGYLQNICIRLAAGLLRQAQYSAISDPQVNGENMYKAAQADLQKLIMKQRVLVDGEGNSLDSPGATGGIEGWPNSSTAGTAKSQGGAPRLFRMGDIQGQPITIDSSGNPQGNLYYGRKW